MKLDKITCYFLIFAAAVFPGVAGKAIAQSGVETDLFAEQKDEDEIIYDLAPYVVKSDGAQSVLLITESDLSQRQAIDLKDALSIDPSVTVGGSTAIAQKIYVRNLGEALLNISIDGATQSGSLFHHTGRIAIEPDLLKSVEVQPGVGSATDGPGALGGAIRFVTKDPEDLLGSASAGAFVKYGYFSNTQGYKASATGFGRLGENWSVLASYVTSDYGEIEDGNGNELAGSGSEQDVVLTKLVGRFGDGHRVRFSFEYLDEKGERLNKPEWAPGPKNPLYPLASERTTSVLGYDFNPASIDWIDLKFTGSYTSADLFQEGQWGPYGGEVEGIQLDLRNAQYVGESLSLVYGFDYRRDEVSAGYRRPENKRAIGEEADVTGFFLQSEIDVTEVFSVSVGARYDSYDLNDREDQDFSSEGFSPNVGIVYEITPEFSVNASYGSAYRGPRIHDAFSMSTAKNDPDLDAERAHNYEVRLVYEKDAWLLEGGLYYNKIEDVIGNSVPWSKTYINVGELESEGLFLRSSYHTKKINISLQYNHADTTIDDQIATRYQYGSTVSRIGNTWVADLMWRPLDQIDVGWNIRLVEELDNILVPEKITGIPDTYIDKPGYTTHDFFLRWQPEFLDSLTINLTIKNAFDEYYRSHGSVEDLSSIPGFGAVVGAPEPGRDIRLSATLRF